MGFQGNVDLHFWITRGMARRLGVNLSEAMHEGLLSQADFAQMVNRCRNCDKSQGCLAYLAEEGRGAAPDWCSNAAVLRELSALS
ncbi:hypothetical protein LPB142_04015 [Rhodobacter xanthinilyticus]|uniref:DUF6455 domain-containing protein n=1 Tax=Rhodobacter xanthinilyticus TaxID=1850250 RepID=A0A1D9M9P2_9RHOB|nr:DUF6455 family protein [Rhodobacter xanthinilyticus]AOZ68585.1 hypothetical protein LPB142_04015 [Rhodobacter xanthinilyticus]